MLTWKNTGPDFTLMVDVQYAFDDPRVVADMAAEWERRGLNVFFLETPLRMDQVRTCLYI